MVCRSKVVLSRYYYLTSKISWKNIRKSKRATCGSGLSAKKPFLSMSRLGTSELSPIDSGYTYALRPLIRIDCDKVSEELRPFIWLHRLFPCRLMSHIPRSVSMRMPATCFHEQIRSIPCCGFVIRTIQRVRFMTRWSSTKWWRSMTWWC